MTYGTNAPQGFQPVRKLDGSAWTGAANGYPIASAYATAIYTGDPVTLLSDGTIGIGVAGAAILGIFQGVEYNDAQGNRQNSPYWPAAAVTQGSVPATAFVIDDPNVVYTIQETNGSGAAGTPLALADVNLNINFVVAAGVAATGQSGTSINNTTEQTTGTLNCKILGLDPTPGNVVGSFANWLVAINNQVFKGGTGTDGV